MSCLIEESSTAPAPTVVMVHRVSAHSVSGRRDDGPIPSKLQAALDRGRGMTSRESRTAAS
jgi:hypothetical protein